MADLLHERVRRPLTRNRSGGEPGQGLVGVPGRRAGRCALALGHTGRPGWSGLTLNSYRLFPCKGAEVGAQRYLFHSCSRTYFMGWRPERLENSLKILKKP
jgi:hypothetical protein